MIAGAVAEWAREVSVTALGVTTPLCLRGRRFDTAHPAVMAIVNRTPDSFYSAARFTDTGEALARIDRVVADGADVVDIGGVRAGQQGAWVDADEEISRVRPVLEETRRRHPDILLSLDTWRSEVAQACDGLVDLVNDTWQGNDPALVPTAARQGAGYVVSHTGGLPPRTDPVHVHYGDDSDEAVLSAVRAGLEQGAAAALAAGLEPEQVLLDPTLDFGKNTEHSLALVRQTGELTTLGFPLMMAISRKDFVGETLGLPAPERLEGSLAATAIAAWFGAVLFRTHDVLATRRVVDMVASIRGDRPPLVCERGR